MKTHEIDGIIYYDEPYEVDHFAFAYDHLDCDAIITGRQNGEYATDRVVAYATDKEKNQLLWHIYLEKYNDGNHMISRHISKEQMNALF